MQSHPKTATSFVSLSWSGIPKNGKQNENKLTRSYPNIATSLHSLSKWGIPIPALSYNSFFISFILWPYFSIKLTKSVTQI